MLNACTYADGVQKRLDAYADTARLTVDYDSTTHICEISLSDEASNTRLAIRLSADQPRDWTTMQCLAALVQSASTEYRIIGAPKVKVEAPVEQSSTPVEQVA